MSRRRSLKTTSGSSASAESPAAGDPQLVSALGLAGLALSLLVLLAVASSVFGFVQDDVYISLRYARNLVGGSGLVFNPGERIAGFSNPAWTLLAALVTRAGLPVLNVLRLLGLACAALLVALVWREAIQENNGSGRIPALAGGLAAFTLAAHPSIGVWAVSGMEQMPFTLLLFSGYVLFRRGMPRESALCLLFAQATRMEAALLAGLIILVRGQSHRSRGTRPSTSELQAVGLYGAGFALMVLARGCYYGEGVPNTYFVKGGATVFTHLRGVDLLREFLGYCDLHHLAGLAAASLVLTLALPARAPADREAREAAVIGAGFLLLYGYYMVRIGGEILPMYRLDIPLLPFLCLWASRSIGAFGNLVITTADSVPARRDEAPSAGPLLGPPVPAAVILRS